MAHACTLYFFVKGYVPKPGQVAPMSTIIWKLGRPDETNVTNTKALEIDVSKHLATGGAIGKDLAYAVHAIKDPNMTLPEIQAMVNDPTFTWKDDALTLSLHCVTVRPTMDDLPNPFCYPSP